LGSLHHWRQILKKNQYLAELHHKDWKTNTWKIICTTENIFLYTFSPTKYLLGERLFKNSSTRCLSNFWICNIYVN
jgi:hypothetical protein